MASTKVRKAPTTTPGNGQRQDDMDEGADRAGAEIGGGLAVARAQLLQVGEDRQRQQHDEEMDKADDGRGARVGKLQRLGDEARARAARR